MHMQFVYYHTTHTMTFVCIKSEVIRDEIITCNKQSIENTSRNKNQEYTSKCKYLSIVLKNSNVSICILSNSLLLFAGRNQCPSLARNYSPKLASVAVSLYFWSVSATTLLEVKGKKKERKRSTRKRTIQRKKCKFLSFFKFITRLL